jgi:hypothetical protein
VSCAAVKKTEPDVNLSLEVARRHAPSTTPAAIEGGCCCWGLGGDAQGWVGVIGVSNELWLGPLGAPPLKPAH